MKYHISFDVDLKRNPYKGTYISLEGIDGSGKTTQVKKLATYFKKQGREVVVTREPRKTEGIIGKFVQQILLGNVKIPSKAFQYLFTADRVMHYEELIIPSLEAGKVVISDRCFWSAIPYGILDRKGPINEKTKAYLLVSQSILSMYHQFIVPDYTFYLHIKAKDAMERMPTKEEGKEIYETREQLDSLYRGYNFLLQEFPKEFIVVDAKQDVKQVTHEIIKEIKMMSSSGLTRGIYTAGFPPTRE